MYKHRPPGEDFLEGKMRLLVPRTCVLLRCPYYSRSYFNKKYCDECSRKYQGRGLTRLLARIRDSHTCQDCGEVRLPEDVGTYRKFRKSLDCHHLKGECGKNSRGYDKMGDISVLISLCHRCHYKRHDFSTTGKIAMRSRRSV